MKSYKQNTWPTNKLAINKTKEGESLETKIERMVNNKEPIKNEAPLIYTDRKDGVQPDYDIRTDRFEVAIDAMDKISKSNIAKREQRIGERTYDTMTEKQQEDFHKKYPKNKHSEEYNKKKNPETGANTSDTK